MGGLGLASVNLSRTIIDPDQEPDDEESDEAIIPEDAGVNLPDVDEAPSPEGGGDQPQPSETEGNVGTPAPPKPTAPEDDQPSMTSATITPRPHHIHHSY